MSLGSTVVRECRICYQYSDNILVVISKIGLDWYWSVTDQHGLSKNMDTAPSEGDAETSAIKYIKEEMNES